jgi:elongation factor G
VRAGDIAAAVGLKDVTPATRCATRKGHHAREDDLPGAGDLGGGRAQDQGRPGKDGHRAAALAKEDPSFRVHTDEESGQTIIAGMGELHLEIIVDRMKREFKVEANVGKPQVAYRETIRGTVESGRQVRRSRAAAASTATCGSRSSRTSRARATSSSTASSAARCRANIIPAVDKGIKEACETGVLAGYPVVDVKVTLFDGSYHDVDSNEMAFKMAGSMGFKDGFRKAKPVLLEPIMKVEVVTPEDYWAT